MEISVRIQRKRYRERSLVHSARRLQQVPPDVSLDMTADMIESMWSLKDAGEKALVRRRR